MNEKVINLGYTTYLQKEKNTKKNWTSNIMNFITKHKILVMCIGIVCMCVLMNMMLIYNFMRILEQSRIY